jgi:ubiquinone/menaquinone biosynthesis C-methylase UbiE/uncharacterized protein YbaR (Trm112 family)
MRPETISVLCCPSDQGELLLREGTPLHGRIEQGMLVCRMCDHRYPIVEGIARLLPARLTGTEAVLPGNMDAEIERKQSEMQARDAQVADYDRMRGLAFFSKIEIPVTLAQLNLRSEDVLLEAGCGTGRMTTTFAARCKTLLAADFSFESLRVCRRKVEASGLKNVDWVQADVCALPCAENTFTRVVSCQVLEHIPTPESRHRMVIEMARVARSPGQVVLSAYQHNLFTRLFGHKEGEHSGGIYYYRFSRRELHALLSGALHVQRMTGALLYHYLARCQKP